MFMSTLQRVMSVNAALRYLSLRPPLLPDMTIAHLHESIHTPLHHSSLRLSLIPQSKVQSENQSVSRQKSVV
ncbi:hypothetical protein G7K_5411-t1 [Saitoella complicata NRRL Y-17804]|uniref:Uncharacterized protein n=1 Tax=Saitoella complicata (strain BCRC 22490 / CBS 7301 / JCM 7358 / NBRC 10748 / NRRL Y-17804) TaxID=698492 RepID=A0A0E9NNM8_SAICN|nr:hypothetical protein G7K_5411-t1 [Saitoella complicata NRRL Y-17804]